MDKTLGNEGMGGVCLEAKQPYGQSSAQGLIKFQLFNLTSILLSAMLMKHPESIT